MQLDLDVLRDRLSADLQSPLHFAESTLTMSGTRRSRDWVRGRLAARAVLAQTGQNPDVTALTLPHPRISITHTAQRALAVALPVDDAAQGLGIDLEENRSPRVDMARFFLTDVEQRWLSTLPEAQQPDQLLRLWTVKEAIFKADLQNSGQMLHRYVIDSPAARVGAATTPCGTRVEYTSSTTPLGVVSVAASSHDTTDASQQRR